jgi:hypothetical protein
MNWIIERDDKGQPIRLWWAGPEKHTFADEAVRNCNTNPRRANTVADAQVEPEIAKTKETQ